MDTVWTRRLAVWFQPDRGLPKGVWGLVCLLGLPPYVLGCLAAIRTGGSIAGPWGLVLTFCLLTLMWLVLSLWLAFCRRRGLARQQAKAAARHVGRPA